MCIENKKVTKYLTVHNHTFGDVRLIHVIDYFTYQQTKKLILHIYVIKPKYCRNKIKTIKELVVKYII